MEIQSSDYFDWLRTIKNKIQKARISTALMINTQLMEVYWDLGFDIVKKQENSNWGDALIEQLSIDLRLSFPDINGFSKRNLYAIRQWFIFYSQQFKFVPQAVAQIPWGHNRLILSKIKNIEEAIFYAKSIIENGWSRDMLEVQIKNNYYKSIGNSTNNFIKTLPEPQSNLANETIRDPYNFDFLGLENNALEREIEKGMVDHIVRFLMELGKGFAFVGKQYPIKISENEYFIDLLFYHLKLRCYVIVELKSGKFKPEYAGKLNFYLSALDSQIKTDNDNPSIGLILCRSKDQIEAEYSLRDIQKPIGISEYQLIQTLPEDLENQFPTIEQIEIQLANFSHENIV